ncbi:MAG TPA: IclR family transcriptional regulator [Candidatus Acidoferrum sp.]|nr:IclR family transcriptional regulator [Candidatus Acidoferrum sp.]
MSVIPHNQRRRSGVQSVEVGAALLRALADADGPRSLGALARAAGMSSAKAHRYLVSYVQAGLVVQSERNGTYDLGPLAVRLGLAAMERFDIVRVAGDRLAFLRDELEETVLLAVWTDAGPTVARIELSRSPVTLAVRVGTAHPVLTSATGHIFLAFAPEAISEGQIAAELSAARSAHVAGTPIDAAGVGRLREEVRSRGMAAVDQTFLVGVRAIAVPLYHGDGRLAAAVTAVGRPDALDLSPDGAPAQALRSFVAACSASLPSP